MDVPGNRREPWVARETTGTHCYALLRTATYYYVQPRIVLLRTTTYYYALLLLLLLLRTTTYHYVLLTYSLTHSLTHLLTYLLTYLFTHPPTYLLTYLLTYYDGFEAGGALRYAGRELTLTSEPRLISFVLYRRVPAACPAVGVAAAV